MIQATCVKDPTDSHFFGGMIMTVNYSQFVKERNKSIKRITRGIYRFSMYGAIMVLFEVAFYTIVKLGKMIPGVKALFSFPWVIDPRLDLMKIWDAPIITLFGQASLWMFLVYGCIGVFGLEIAFAKVKNWTWYFRGLIYMVIIMSFDWLSGFSLRLITGYDIWINPESSPLTIFGKYGYTTWAVAPMWFIVGLISENLMRLVQRFTEMKYILYAKNIPDRLEEHKDL
jgi:hypothetical protein